MLRLVPATTLTLGGTAGETEVDAHLAAVDQVPTGEGNWWCAAIAGSG